MTPNGSGDVTPKVEVRHDHSVGMAEELDRVDADDRRAGALLGFAERPRLLRRDREAGFATRHERVGDPLAGRGPLGDGARCPVFEVVGMGDDRQPRRPVLRQRFQGHIRHRPERTARAKRVPPRRSRSRGPDANG